MAYLGSNNMAPIICLLFGALLFTLSPLCVQAQECGQGISVVAPEVAVPGKTTAVLVTLHGPQRAHPLNVTLRLVSDRAEEMTQLLMETSREITGHGIIPLAIPVSATGSCILQSLVNCSSDDCSVQSNSALQLVGAVRDVIIRPSRKNYRPGDMVDFWVLALDHDLSVPSDMFGSVFVRTPQGTKVALWEEVALDEGVRSFSLPLSPVAQLGIWEVQVEVDSDIFSAQFNVSITGGSTIYVVPEVAMAEEHYVELRFGHEMRRLYKPGLPFVGKVEAVSTEKCVRVRVKVYDNTTAIYSQDIEITSGEGTFVVPAILADSDIITLQAELVSVEGKEIDSHYVLAREPIRKWNSTSDCYLLIEGAEHTLQPDEMAHVVVLSTCPCERDIHYVITTEGHVTYWSDKPSEVLTDSDNPPTQNIDGAAICRLNFSFEVKAVMAPVSHLLVYYITEDGEPISDDISFDIKLLLKQMSVSTESRKSWNPKQEMNVSIVAQPGALVCLVGGRAGSGTDLRALDNNSTKSHKRFSFREMDFLDAGVAFFQRQCVRRGLGFDSQTQFYSHGSSYTEEKHKSVVAGTNIDNLWLWKCFSYRDNVSEMITAPEEPGKWSLWVLSLAPNVGLRFSSPLAVSVFRPLQVDFQLPYSLKVGEAVEVDVRIGNNINSCMDVTALLALTEGAHFLSNNMLYVTEKLRLGPHGATSIVVRVVVTSPGNKNMTVQVSGYGSDSCRDSVPLNSTLVESVVRSATVLVHPEGLVRTDTESAYFCANEKMVISTCEEFRYEFVPAPRNRAGVVFEVKVSHGAHIILSHLQYTSEQMYQVVLGDLDNTVTWIGRGKHGFGVHLKSKETPQLLSGDIFRTFWLSWDKGVVAVGRGPLFHNDTLIEWRIDKKMKIQHLGFASGWGLTAEFRVWRYNNEAGFSQVLHLNVPRSVVPGTEQGTLTVSGGLSLPSASQTAALLRHRHGLGESTSLAASISMFTPFLPLQHQRDLDNSSMSKDKVVLSLKKELQVLLTFMKPDFSFGDHRTQGSHRDTVTILELLSKVQSYLSVDPELMVGIKRWIQQRQSDDGSFSPLPNDTTVQDITANNKNSFKLETLHQNVEITAETLTTLLEVGLENEVDSEVMLRARYFLERSLFRVTSPCSLALLTFALVLAKSDLTSAALNRLQNYSTNEEGDFSWRESTNKDTTDWLYEEGSGRRRKEPIMTSVGDYKASLFTLMTYSMLGDLKSAEPVARYLFYRSHLLDRHSELLYTAVKGFAMFGALAKDRHRALTVSLATSGMELTDTLEMRDDTPVQVLQLPSLPTKVFVYATGAGCATVQGEVSYSTYSPSIHSTLLDLWAGVEDEFISGHNTPDQMEGKLPRLNLKTCFRWKATQPSGVVRLEVTLFSGFQLTKVSPVVVDITGDTKDIHHGTRHDKIWFILANVSGACPVCVRYTVQSLFVVSALRPAFARVYPAGRADLGTETFFHTQRTSPLLADVTDDDIITWFGNKDMGQPHLSSDFAEVCECGRLCVSNNIEVNNTSQPYNHVVMPNMEATNSIIFTNQTMKKHKTIMVDNKTAILSPEFLHAQATKFPKPTLLKTLNNGNSSFNNFKLHRDYSKGNCSKDECEDETNLLFEKSTNDRKSNESVSISSPLKLVSTNTTENEKQKVSKPKEIFRSEITIINSSLKWNSTQNGNQHQPNNIYLEEPKQNGELSTKLPTLPSHSINKERQHLGEESLLPTVQVPTSNSESPRVGNSERLFVLDKDTLWGMLREVVHGELQKNTVIESSTKKNKQD